MRLEFVKIIFPFKSRKTSVGKSRQARRENGSTVTEWEIFLEWDEIDRGGGREGALSVPSPSLPLPHGWIEGFGICSFSEWEKRAGEGGNGRSKTNQFDKLWNIKWHPGFVIKPTSSTINHKALNYLESSPAQTGPRLGGGNYWIFN